MLALCSAANLVLFRVWSVDHLHQDHLGFSFQAHSWVHASDLLNKNLCSQGPGICNKLHVDPYAPEGVKSTATNSCPGHVPGPIHLSF